jgi:hypothetical protein
VTRSGLADLDAIKSAAADPPVRADTRGRRGPSDQHRLQPRRCSREIPEASCPAPRRFAPRRTLNYPVRTAPALPQPGERHRHAVRPYARVPLLGAARRVSIRRRLPELDSVDLRRREVVTVSALSCRRNRACSCERQLQRLAQCDQICVAWTRPTVLPEINAGRADAHPVGDIVDRQAAVETRIPNTAAEANLSGQFKILQLFRFAVSRTKKPLSLSRPEATIGKSDS